jgi:hypothetical protein
VPEGNITTTSTISANINFPPIPNGYYYANGYAIFYRIYSSILNTSSISPNDYNLISPSLYNDYNYFLPISNPANASATISTNTFRSRNFFELEFEGKSIADMLPKTGGTLWIDFPTAPGLYPTALGVNKLLRSSKLTSPLPSDRYFLNTFDLRLLNNASSIRNADVAGQQGNNIDYTYAAMYIVAVGTHPTNFTTIYSKPTFISVFRLP